MNYLNKILLISLILALGSCQKADQTALQKKYLEDKIEDYKEYRWKSCRQEILLKAEARSDSFFVAMAKGQTFDSTEAPQAIRRPQKPEVKIREDSLPLKPMLNKDKEKTVDSLPKDSLNQNN